MRIPLIALVATLLSAFTGSSVVAQNARVASDRVSAAKVSAAIDRCVSFLVNEQKKDGQRGGSWVGNGDYGTGQTCLVTLALLSAGKTAKSPEVSRALTHIRAHKNPKRTYEAALQVMVLAAAEPAKDMKQIKDVTEWLVNAQTSSGGWSYGEIGGGDGDESNTQFAVLALWEASKLGINVNAEVKGEKDKSLVDAIRKCEQYWLKNRIGAAWGYQNRGPSGSMACAGIASMVILQEATTGVDASVGNDGIQCCGGQKEVSHVDQAMQWLASNIALDHNPHGQGYTLYYLYALERVGRLTGQRLIGNRDWYREGAEFLLSTQLTGGSFRDGHDEVSSTAMALLFLSKGKRQVVVGHLQYGNDNNWQKHRRAIQNLTGQIESVWKRELAWQSVRLEQADLASLLETPILFISGTREFKLNDAQRNLLREYTNNGGFIFAEACNGDGCKGDEFDKSFRIEMEKIFDKSLQKIPPSHPIWTAETRVDPNALPMDFWLYGLDACCRTSVVYSPISLSCRWELARPFGIVKKYPPAIDGDIMNAVKLGVNVAAYATGRELKDKLDAVQIVQQQKNRQPLDRGSLAIGKIMHSGGGDDTPKAVSNLLEFYRTLTQSLVENKTPMISLNSDEVQKYPILYIHGRNKFRFTDEEASGLRKHFETAGIVLGDAICASADFSESVQKEFSKALPESSWRTIEPKHALMQRNDGTGNFDLSNVTLLDPSSPSSDIKQAKRDGPAQIMALEWKGRIVMLFSPNDLSCALESKHSMQCRGYVREHAFHIGTNMILFGLGLSN